MGAPADRLNRAVLMLLGLLLTAAGAATLVRSFGAFGRGRAEEPLLGAGVVEYADRHDPWFWIAVATVGLLAALLSLRWLLAQLTTDRVGRLDLEPDPRGGATVLQASAVTTALCEEVQSYRGVQAASARLLHDPRRPDLVLHVDLDEHADIAATRRRIEQDAVLHARQALDVPVLPARVILRPAKAGLR